MSDLTQPRGRVAVAAIRTLMAVVAWVLLVLYIIANSTIVGEPTDWAKVARISAWGFAPLALAAVAGVLQPRLRLPWRGWTGVLMSWTAAFAAFFVAAWALGPFI